MACCDLPSFSIARLSAGEEQEGRDGHPPDHPGQDDLDVKRLSVGATVLYIILLLLSMP